MIRDCFLEEINPTLGLEGRGERAQAKRKGRRSVVGGGAVSRG